MPSSHELNIDFVHAKQDVDSYSEDDEAFKTIRFISGRRRLLPEEGVMRTLIIRVTDSAGNTPVTDGRRESDVWFGSHNMKFAGNLNSMVSI